MNIPVTSPTDGLVEINTMLLALVRELIEHSGVKLNVSEETRMAVTALLDETEARIKNNS